MKREIIRRILKFLLVDASGIRDEGRCEKIYTDEEELALIIAIAIWFC